MIARARLPPHDPPCTGAAGGVGSADDPDRVAVDMVEVQQPMPAFEGAARHRVRARLRVALRGCARRRSWAAPRAPFPAVVGPGATDEPTDHDERQGQPQPELDHDPAAFGAPAQLAVLVGPGVGALHRPTPARLYGHGLAARGGLTGPAPFGQPPA